MTEQEQRIAIAEACGWKWLTSDEVQPKCRFLRAPDYKPPFPGIHETDDMTLPASESVLGLPDYPNDLNAMRDATLKLNEEQQSQFAVELMLVLGIDPNTPTEPSEMFEFCNATSDQRAEAFLRTIGKWKE